MGNKQYSPDVLAARAFCLVPLTKGAPASEERTDIAPSDGVRRGAKQQAAQNLCDTPQNASMPEVLLRLIEPK